jgi:hypothetical protein
MDPITPSELRLEFSETVSPEVLGLLIRATCEKQRQR